MVSSLRILAAGTVVFFQVLLVLLGLMDRKISSRLTILLSEWRAFREGRP